METIRIRYKKLFQVDILLHHLLDSKTQLFDNLTPAERQKKLDRYDLSQWVTIEPTASCRTSLAGLGWVFKLSRTGFAVAASVEAVSSSVFKPKNAPGAALKLDFEVTVSDPAFTGFSALPVPGKLDGGSAFYLFDNKNAHSDGTAFPSLAVKPPVFSLTTEYLQGEIVRNQSKRFQAKTKNLGVSTTDTARWAEITESLDYANGAQKIAPENVTASGDAFGLIRIHCQEGLSSFSLFNSGNLTNPVFKIRLKKLTT